MIEVANMVIPIYFCEEIVLLKTSWTEVNPRRRFLNCKSYGAGWFLFFFNFGLSLVHIPNFSFVLAIQSIWIFCLV